MASQPQMLSPDSLHGTCGLPVPSQDLNDSGPTFSVPREIQHIAWRVLVSFRHNMIVSSLSYHPMRDWKRHIVAHSSARVHSLGRGKCRGAQHCGMPFSNQRSREMMWRPLLMLQTRMQKMRASLLAVPPWMPPQPPCCMICRRGGPDMTNTPWMQSLILAGAPTVS